MTPIIRTTTSDDITTVACAVCGPIADIPLNLGQREHRHQLHDAIDSHTRRHRTEDA